MQRRISHFGIAAVISIVSPCSPAADQPMKKPEPACQLCAVDLKEGITRKEAEAKIAEVLGRRSDYSPYSDHFKGGTVLYREGDWLLRVTYSEGMAGPYVINGKGIVEHLAPIDETVLSYELLEK